MINMRLFFGVGIIIYMASIAWFLCTNNKKDIRRLIFKIKELWKNLTKY